MVDHLHIQLLDHVQARTADGQVPPSLQQARKLAVLAYLALEQRRVPRAELATLLWGENTEESARGSLRQILHAIRHDCGFDPFIADRTFVRLSARVTCDVAEFYRALEQGQSAASVVAKYGGAFMRGFTIGDARAFEEWCDQQQRRFDATLADAAFAAAKQCADAREALTLLDVVARVHPWEESILRRRMQCMQQLGDHNAGLALYDTYRAQLAEEFGRSPQADTLVLADMLRTQAAAQVVAPADVPTGVDAPAAPRGPLHMLLRRHAAKLTGAAMLGASIWLGAYSADWTAASPDDLPLVAVNITVAGADDARENAVRNQVSARLAEDTSFRVSTGRPSAADVVVSIALDVSDGMHGTATVSHQSGTILATLPVVYTSSTEQEAIADLARKLRREVSIILAPDSESANAARLHYRLDDAQQAVKDEGYGMARTTLAALHRDLDTLPLHVNARRHLRSRWWEIQSNITVKETRDFTRGLEQLRNAIRALGDNSTYDDEARQRLVKLHFNAYAFSQDDSNDQLALLVAQAERIAPHRRAPATWAKLAQSHFYLGNYGDAHAAGAEARRALASLGTNDELDMVMFESALALERYHEARAECERMKRRAGNEWHGVACAAVAMGWADADYTPRQLLKETNALDGTDPARADYQQYLATVIAAASARRGHRALADSLLLYSPPSDDEDQILYRAAALKELGRVDEARALLHQLEQSLTGRRTVRGSPWLRLR